MKTNNLDTYKLLMMNMTEEKKAKLAFLVNGVVEVEGKKRVIRKILGAKDKKETELLNGEEHAEEDNEEEASEFKRARVIQKRKQGKKKSR
jgi:hypothetical protein